MTTPHLKLISFATCPYVQRARVILNEKQIQHELEYIDLDAPPGWFYEVSPLEKVPVLLVENKPLFESMVICEYLDEVSAGSLHPEEPFAKARNRSWIEFGNEILSNNYGYFTTDDSIRFKQLRATILEQLDILEEELSNSPFFNGAKFSLIDAVYAPLFRMFDVLHRVYDYNFFTDTAKVKLWSDTLLAHPSVVNSIPAGYGEDMEVYLKKQNSVLNRA